MSAQSYIKFWTAEPSEHEEVQAYDLLGYEYDFRKETTPNGKVTGKTYGGKIRVSIAGFPTEELLEWMFNSRILKDGEVMNTSCVFHTKLNSQNREPVIMFLSAETFLQRSSYDLSIHY